MVGGADAAQIYSGVSVKTSYTNEMASLGGTNKPTTGTTNASNGYYDDIKVGLMYVSDYGYAATPNYWLTNLNSYNTAAAATDWMFDGFSGSTQWTISRRGDYTSDVFYVHSYGGVNYYYAGSSYVVRPSFYLDSSVEFLEGTGEAGSPWLLSMN